MLPFQIDMGSAILRQRPWQKTSSSFNAAAFAARVKEAMIMFYHITLSHGIVLYGDIYLCFHNSWTTLKQGNFTSGYYVELAADPRCRIPQALNLLFVWAPLPYLPHCTWGLEPLWDAEPSLFAAYSFFWPSLATSCHVLCGPASTGE